MAPPVAVAAEIASGGGGVTASPEPVTGRSVPAPRTNDPRRRWLRVTTTTSGSTAVPLAGGGAGRDLPAALVEAEVVVEVVER